MTENIINCTTENGEKLQLPNAFNSDKDGFICAYHCNSMNSDNFKPRMVCLCEAVLEKDSDIDIYILKIYY